LVIGTGSIGERHVRCLLATGRADVGICEPDEVTRGRVEEVYSLDHVFASIDEAFGLPWDSVVVATPAPTHIPLAMRAVQSGCAALIEKPLAVEPTGVESLIEEASGRGLPLGVAYVQRAHPALQAMKKSIDSGQFGRPVQLIAVVGQHFPTYRPAYADTYYARHEAGGGAIQDALTHMVNGAEWLVGPITRVAALADHCVLDTVDVEDTVSMLAQHERVIATYHLNQHQAPNECSLQVVCTEGTCRYEPNRHAWSWMTKPDTPWQEEVTTFASRDDWFIHQAHAWLDTLENGVAPLCTVEEALQTLHVNRAALASASQGGTWQTITKEVML
jgi:predicted dehydrogenase